MKSPLSTRPAAGWNRMGWALVGAACVLRLAHYLANRSLWLDELMVALNIRNRGFGGLIEQPLEFDQCAPPLFLWLVKGVSLVAGHAEPALRLVPLLAGFCGVILFYTLARRWLGPRRAVAALLLFALSYPLIYYSQELKQYTLDVAVTLGLLHLGDRALRPERLRRSRFLAGLGLAGAVAPWISHASGFVLAPVGIAVLAALLRDGVQRGDRRRLAFLLVMWAAGAMFPYTLIARHALGHDAIQVYWNQGYLRLPYTVDRAVDSALVFVRFFHYAGLFRSFAPLVPVVFITGIVMVYRRDRLRSVLLVMPFLLAAAASLAGVYPFHRRLVLFLVPLLYLLVVEGAGMLLQMRRRWLGCLIVLLAFVPFAIRAPRSFRPVRREETRPLIDYLAAEIQPGDDVYLNSTALPAARYYAPGQAGTWEIVEVSNRSGFDHAVRHGSRWLLLAHVGKEEEQDLLAGWLEARPRVWRKPGAALYRWEPGRGPGSGN